MSAPENLRRLKQHEAMEGASYFLALLVALHPTPVFWSVVGLHSLEACELVL